MHMGVDRDPALHVHVQQAPELQSNIISWHWLLCTYEYHHDDSQCHWRHCSAMPPAAIACFSALNCICFLEFRWNAHTLGCLAARHILCVCATGVDVCSTALHSTPEALCCMNHSLPRCTTVQCTCCTHLATLQTPCIPLEPPAACVC
jgi:hypothetical protein